MLESLIFGVIFGLIGFTVVIGWSKSMLGIDDKDVSFLQIFACAVIAIIGVHLVFYNGNLSELWRSIAYKDVPLKSSFSILNLGFILSGCIFGAAMKVVLSRVISDKIGSQSQERQAYKTQKREYKYTYQGNFGHQKASQKAEPFKPYPRPKTRRELNMEVLGLSHHCNKDEIKTAYKKLAKKYHPDQFVSADLSETERVNIETKMKDINAAYSYLMAE